MSLRLLKLPVLLSLAIISMLCSCSQPKALVYQDVNSFRVHNVDLQQATVVLQLRFYNPNSYNLTIKKGDVDAYFDNRYVGKAFIDERTNIPASDTFLLPVTITAPLTAIVTNTLALLADNEVVVKLNGSMSVGKDGIFVRIPVHYEGKTAHSAIASELILHIMLSTGLLA